MAAAAPYASTPIPLYLGSLTGMRYRTLNCLECGREFLERNNETMYRVGDQTLPAEVAVSSESVKATCGNCQQWYAVQVSMTVQLERDSVPLYLQPESIYVVSEMNKHLRQIYCLECGKAFHGISDRISQVVDNIIPMEYIEPTKAGPISALCHFNNCGQTWALML